MSFLNTLTYSAITTYLAGTATPSILFVTVSMNAHLQLLKNRPIWWRLLIWDFMHCSQHKYNHLCSKVPGYNVVVTYRMEGCQKIILRPLSIEDSDLKIGFIGAGKMAQALTLGFVHAGKMLFNIHMYIHSFAVIGCFKA